MKALTFVLCAAPVLALVLAASPASADADDTIAIAFEQYALDNGLEVILHQDRSVPLVAVSVWYHVGSGDEEHGRSGFAHLFEHMMFQGARHIGEDVHFDILREIGASRVNGTTNKDRTNYFEVVPSNHLETALWLESDRMGYMLDLLTEESFANQRDVVRNERRQRYDNVAFGRSRFAVHAGLYPEGHPYRYLTIGRHEDLEAATLDDVRSFFVRWYVPSNATITLAGDFAIDEAKALLNKWFGSFPKLEKPTRSRPALPVLVKPKRTTIDDPFAAVERLDFAWHAPANLEPGTAELDLLARILGSSGWGRLYKRLVLDEAIAKRVSVWLSRSGASSSFRVRVEVVPGQEAAAVEKAVREEIARVADELVDDAELQRAINAEEASFIWPLESLMSRAERLQWFNHYTGQPGYADEYLRQIRSVGPEAILATAKEWLTRHEVLVISRPAPQTPESADTAEEDER